MSDARPGSEGSRGLVDRRTVLAAGAAVAAFGAVHAVRAPVVLGQAAPFELMKLPYERTALQPHLSGETIDIHHGKHHAAYVKNLNGLIPGSGLEGATLAEVVRQTAGKPDRVAIFNNAAQVWNHDFYWKGLRPGGGGKPTGALLGRIEASFGGFDACREALAKAAVGQFGSGWAWLVADGDRIEVVATGNADTPLSTSKRPLWTIDVWEHAYYVDWRNRRKDYVDAVLDHLVNWEFAAENLAAS